MGISSDAYSLKIFGKAWSHEGRKLYGTDRPLSHRRHSGIARIPERHELRHRLHRTGKCENVCEESVIYSKKDKPLLIIPSTLQ